jgi:hypothetical protein
MLLFLAFQSIFPTNSAWGAGLHVHYFFFFGGDGIIRIHMGISLHYT